MANKHKPKKPKKTRKSFNKMKDLIKRNDEVIKKLKNEN